MLCHEDYLSYLFGEEVCADGRLVLVGELLVDVLVHQGGLAHATVPKDDHLNAIMQVKAMELSQALALQIQPTKRLTKNNTNTVFISREVLTLLTLSRTFFLAPPPLAMLGTKFQTGS